MYNVHSTGEVIAVTNRGIPKKMSVVSELTDLPEDVVRAICARVPSRDLARFCIACRVALRCVDQSLCAGRLLCCGISTQSDLRTAACLEILGLHDMLVDRLAQPGAADVITSQVGFEFGGTMLDDDDGNESGIANSQGCTKSIAEMLQHHSRASLVIETHVGLTAPGSIAFSYCAMRGAVIAAALVWHHNIGLDRLRVRGWGRRITRKAARSSHPNGATARAGYGWGELFIELHGATLPERPDYYDAAAGLTVRD